MQLIVAEKPSVARDLARVLGVAAQGKQWFEGNGVLITWCIGHLVELEEPAAYDGRWKAWRLDTLPMLPEPFRLRGSKHALPQLKAVAALLKDRRVLCVVNACDAGREGELIFRYVYQYAGARAPVRRLWISSLTDDAIRRGFASLRPGRDFEPLADAARSRSEADWLVGMNATRAVTVRGRDAGHTALFSIGRVQTPTLAMLVERERAITAFVRRDYWEVRADLTTAAGEAFTAHWRHGKASRLGSAALAEAVVARDRVVGTGAVERVEHKTVREPPPLLFDLTTLQRTANRRFGWPAARTLELAQALYERHKLLTYPRTDSRYLTTDVVPELPGILDAVAARPDYAPFVAALDAQPAIVQRPGRRIVDDAKVHDHHAIIPTAKRGGGDSLGPDERKLFDLVTRRFLGVFFPDAEIAATEVWVRVGDARLRSSAPGGDAAPERRDPRGASTAAGDSPSERTPRDRQDARAREVATAAEAEAASRIVEALPPPPDRFVARGRVRLVAGWQAVAGIDARAATQDRDRADDAAPTLPKLVVGEVLAGAFASRARQTTPPPRYTEATLLAAMESAGRAMDDEELRAAMRDTGLGTPATRASIIETLLQRAYIVRARQELVPTPTGIGLIAALPIADLGSAELTGRWEARLARIARGEEARGAFMADIARYVESIIAVIRGGTAAPIPPPSAGGRGGDAASACGGARWSGAAGGRGGPGGPDKKTAWRQRGATAGASRGRSSSNGGGGPRRSGAGPGRGVGFPSERTVAAGPPRERTVAVDSPRERTVAADSPRERTVAAGSPRARIAAALPTRITSTRAVAELACPRCQRGQLLTGSRGWGCSRWREGCAFVIWFEMAGRKVSSAQLRDLVIRGKTRPARFETPQGQPIKGWLVLDAGRDGGAATFHAAQAPGPSPVARPGAASS